MTLNLPLLYVLWLEEYCQISPNKNRSPNLWHVTSILVCCIFGWHSSLCTTWHQCRLNTGDFIDLLFTYIYPTDKRTDAWWDIFMIWKIDFGLLAVGWAGLWNKRFGPIMSNFWGRFFQLFVGKKKFKKKFENIVASALKSCIEKKVKNCCCFLGRIFYFRKTSFF